jgi:hypothetical protein
VGENVCQLYIRQGTDNQNIQGTLKTNSPKINEPIKKWASEKTELSQKKKFKWPKNT